VKKTLLHTFDESPLLAIRTTLEGFRLAYLINKYLAFFLQRTKEDIINFEQDAKFMHFKFNNIKEKYTIHLFENKTKKENFFEEKSLFQQPLISHTYLFPEFKNVDFFIKTMDKKYPKISHKLNTIKNIEMAYIIPNEKIKSKKNLNII